MTTTETVMELTREENGKLTVPEKLKKDFDWFKVILFLHLNVLSLLSLYLCTLAMIRTVLFCMCLIINIIYILLTTFYAYFSTSGIICGTSWCYCRSAPIMGPQIIQSLQRIENISYVVPNFSRTSKFFHFADN